MTATEITTHITQERVLKTYAVPVRSVEQRGTSNNLESKRTGSGSLESGISSGPVDVGNKTEGNELEERYNISNQ